jgi:NADPH-dependent 2,4-dienoyl-CoA reductase/sulfur reductase-like enzyme
VLDKDGRESRLPYDELVIGTGATPVRLPIGGLDTLGPGLRLTS